MSEPCPVCGGDESKCDYDYQSERCSEAERRLNPCPYSEAEIDRAQCRYELLFGFSAHD